MYTACTGVEERTEAHRVLTAFYRAFGYERQANKRSEKVTNPIAVRYLRRPQVKSATKARQMCYTPFQHHRRQVSKLGLSQPLGM